MSTTRVFPAAPPARRRRKRWDGSLQPAAGGTTGTLGAASAAGSVAFAGTNTPPATTGTLGAASASGSVAFAGLNTPPATTGSLAAGSAAGSVAFAGFAVVGSVGTLAPASATGSVAFAALNTPPATTGTLGASAAAGSVALAGLAVVGNAGTLGASAASGSVAFAALAVAPAVTGTLGAAAAASRVSFLETDPVIATGNGPWPHAVWANAVWANAVWAGTGAGTPTPTPTAPDLVAAAVAYLRSFGGGSVAAALGESAGAAKVWSDEALGGPGLPWVRITEVGETQGEEARESDGLVHYYGEGTLQVSVFAAGKKQARDLRRTLVSALNDAPLVFADGALLHFRVKNASMPPEPDVSVGAPVAYHALAEFTYVVDRTY